MSGFGAALLPKPGDVVDGKFTLERLLGKGGMGAVFAARHNKLGHAVAIKIMLADAGNAEAAQRFINEGRAAANIQNDHVVRVSDVDEEHGYAFMVLELLEGEDLAQVLDREKRLAPHVAVGFVLQALRGVKQAHAQGIVHRDLKPSNLFLARRQDGSIVVKVLDFGISKANNTSALGMAPSALTSTAAMLGSPLYMSPEQLRSSKNVDARADIWAMGVILFELVTGTLPFEGETLGALFSAILESDAPRVRSRVDSVPPGLEAVIARCLQRRAEDRFQSVADLERELAPFSAAAGAMGSPYAFTAVAPSSGHLPSATGPMGTTGPAHNTMPRAGSPTGSGPHDVVVKGTVPLGAVTPQPHQHQQTGSTWQSTGNRTQAKPSATGLVLGGVALSLVLAGIGVAGVMSWKAKQVKDRSAAAASASAAQAASVIAVPDPSVTSPPPAAAASDAPNAVVASSTPPSAASTTPAVAAAPTTKHRPAAAPMPVAVKVEPPKVEPPKVEPPKPEPPKVITRPAPTPTGGTLQGNR